MITLSQNIAEPTLLDKCEIASPGETRRRVVLFVAYLAAVAIATAFSPAVGLVHLASHVK